MSEKKKLDYKYLRKQVGRWDQDNEEGEIIDLVDIPTTVPKCEGCDCPSVCIFTDKKYSEGKKSSYLCAKHKNMVEKVYASCLMEYDVRYI